MRAGISAILGLALCVALAARSRPARAQIVETSRRPQRAAAAEVDAPHGASTRELTRRFQRGRQALEEQNFSEAARLFQSMLESEEDVFFSPDSRQQEAGLKLSVEALLGRLPDQARDVYEKQFGPAARRLLDQAERRHDVDLLADCARLYLHTQAGAEAAYRLAADYFDHERPLTAALLYERLRGLPEAAPRFEPHLSIKTALSWLRAGSNSRAVAVLSELKARHPDGRVRVGGRDVPLFADPERAFQWLTANFGAAGGAPAVAGDQWTMPGGDARRNALSAGGSPYLNQGWRVSTVTGTTTAPEYDALVTRAIRERQTAAEASEGETPYPAPAVPAMQPLVIGDLVVVRSLGDVRAFELASGRLVWASSEKDPLLMDTLRSSSGPQAQVPGLGAVALVTASRAWEDTGYGSLSSDGTLVFAVEDLNAGYPAALFLQRLGHNSSRLVAYEVKTGRAVWEIGGGRGDLEEDVAGTYFLGAPLVFDHRLYCLGETGSEARLFVLDPQTGAVLWSQTISSDAPSGPEFFRRGSAVAPSLSGETIICPIASDQIVAVDLNRHALLWRYRFHDPDAPLDPRRQEREQRLSQQGIWFDQNHWLDSTPLISGNFVVFTPREANELYCLNLENGDLIWRKPREEGLFVAGIHQDKVLIVGRSYVQALSVADGSPAWPEPASLGVPSGRGFVTGDFLHLPLASAEVATVSLRDGRVVARARSLSGNVPGNLAAVRGAVVSQGADFVEAFRPLDALEADIDRALAKDPDDAAALALRGEIGLQRGNTLRAYADLKRALALKSDDAVVRSLLIGSLLEGLRVDFESYRGLSSEIEPLLAEPQQRAAYLWLVAQGQKRAGEMRAALATLLEFSAPAVADRELERVDGALAVRRDRLVRARAGEIYAAAAPDERAAMDRDFQGRASALEAARDPEAIRRFLRYFGGLGDVSRLERLAAELPLGDADWLAGELELEPIAQSRDARAAAAAVARGVQMLLAAGRPRDALPLIRRLEAEWPEVVCSEDKTGREFAAECRKRSDLERELALEAAWPRGKAEVERLESVPGPGGAQRFFDIPVHGSRAPFLVDVSLQIGANWKDFVARDAFGRQLWRLTLDVPVPQSNLSFARAFVHRHFVLVCVGNQLLAIDTLGTADEPGARLLWKTSFSGPAQAHANPRGPAGFFRRGIRPFNQVGEQIGAIGPVTREQVVLLSGQKLLALDLLTGKPLWTREGVAAGSELFGDERVVYLIPPDGGDWAVYNALDGTVLGERPQRPARWRIETLGRKVVEQRTQGGRQVLALYDPVAEKDAWIRSFEDTAQVAVVELDEAAVLEPSGKLTVLSLEDGAVRFETPIEPEPQVRQIHFLRSRDEYVLIANQVVGNALPGWQPVFPQGTAVRGRAYGFDRQTGRRLWTTPLEAHGIDLRQPQNLPVLTFISNFTRPRNAAPGLENHFGLSCLDKRTGKLVFDDRNFDEHIYFVEFTADPDEKSLELRLFKSTLRLTFTDKPGPGE